MHSNDLLQLSRFGLIYSINIFLAHSFKCSKSPDAYKARNKQMTRYIHIYKENNNKKKYNRNDDDNDKRLLNSTDLNTKRILEFHTHILRILI